ncbi:uncharacterized protein LOC34619677 [Cyclospora cayetanensis]|uniref:Uncharacterized protein LOC34619677 n=1 Tax=Cyclospora cayetanensis TaxID=88456 RepID=A0A6P5WDR8_9EIME|nr:uncharacterized protein LOC34619677 [Cyclospora cayetanensis]
MPPGSLPSSSGAGSSCPCLPATARMSKPIWSSSSPSEYDGGGSFCSRFCRSLDWCLSECLCPPFDVAFKRRLRQQLRLVLLFFVLSTIAAAYPFAFLSLVEAQYPSIRPLHLPDVSASAAAERGGYLKTTRTEEPAPPAALRAAAAQPASAMALIMFVPPKTEHLYSFDRGLLYALLYWGLLLLVPCQALLLLVAVAVSQAGDRALTDEPHKGRDCAARLVSVNSRWLTLNSCLCSPSLAALCCVNLSAFFAAAPSHRLQLGMAVWTQLAISLLIHFPLGIHVRNAVKLFEGAAALQLLQHALEADHRLSAAVMLPSRAPPPQGAAGKENHDEQAQDQEQFSNFLCGDKEPSRLRSGIPGVQSVSFRRRTHYSCVDPLPSPAAGLHSE